MNTLKYLSNTEQFLFHSSKLHYITQHALEHMEQQNPSVPRSFSRKEKIQSWFAANIFSPFLEDEIDVRYCERIQQERPYNEYAEYGRLYNEVTGSEVPSTETYDSIKSLGRLYRECHEVSTVLLSVKRWYQTRGWDISELNKVEAEINERVLEVVEKIDLLKARPEEINHHNIYDKENDHMKFT